MYSENLKTETIDCQDGKIEPIVRNIRSKINQFDPYYFSIRSQVQSAYSLCTHFRNYHFVSCDQINMTRFS